MSRSPIKIFKQFFTDGRKIFEESFNSSAYNPRKDKIMNQIYLKIKQDADQGTVIAMFNPDMIQNFHYNGNAQLLYLEAQKEKLRVRFATSPKIDEPTESEFVVEPTNTEMSYNVIVLIFECYT